MYRIKPTGRRLFKSLTQIERKQIVERTLAGETQIALAIAFECGDSIIRRVCKAAGVGRWAAVTPELETEAVRLLGDGVAIYRIAKKTRLQGDVIKTLMVKHGIVHPVGGGPKLPREKREKILEAVTRREDFCNQPGKRFGVTKDAVRRIAHEALGPARFRKGRVYPPLSSEFPQRQVRLKIAAYVDKFGGNEKAMPRLRDRVSEETLFLLDFVITKCFNGQMPDNQVEFAELIADWCIKQVPPSTWQAIDSCEQEIVKHHFALEFLAATESWRIAHQTPVPAWAN